MTEVWTASESAKQMGYTNTEAWIRAARKAGIPFAKINHRKFVFDPEAIKEWIRENAERGGSKCGKR